MHQLLAQSRSQGNRAFSPANTQWLRAASFEGIEHVRRRSPYAIDRHSPQLGSESTVAARQSLRQAEFRCGRSCARQAILRAKKRRHGWDADHRLLSRPVIGQLPSRAPSWPAGYVGSITHSRNWVWAAVASDQQLCGLGIDTEPVADANIARQVAPSIGHKNEWQSLDDALGWPHAALFSLLFSAKETFYKLWQPLTGLSFDFLDVSLTGSARSAVADRGLVGELKLQLSSCRTDAICTAEGSCAGKSDLSEPLEIQFQWTGSDLFTLAWVRANHKERPAGHHTELEEDSR